MFLTDVLETNGAGSIVKVDAADVQRVQLCYVMPSYLRKGQHSSGVFQQIQCLLETDDHFLF